MQSPISSIILSFFQIKAFDQVLYMENEETRESDTKRYFTVVPGIMLRTNPGKNHLMNRPLPVNDK